MLGLYSTNHLSYYYSPDSSSYIVFMDYIFYFSMVSWMLNMNEALVLWNIFPYQNKHKTKLKGLV